MRRELHLFLLLLILSMYMEWTLAGKVNKSIENIPYHQINPKNIKGLIKLNPIDILGDYLTPSGDNVSPICEESGKYYKQQLAEQSPWAMQMFDADPKFPHSGLLEGNFIHYPGAFDECLRSDAGDFLGKYCLMSIYQTENEQERHLYSLEAHLGRKRGLVPEWLLGPNPIRVATCIPSTCTNDDAMFGFNNFLNEIAIAIEGEEIQLSSYAIGCQSKDEEVPLTSGDLAMLVFLMAMGLLISISTLIDLYQRFVTKDKFSDRFLGIIQGFSAYHNTIKLFDTKTTSDNFGCINGIRFISMTWVLIGHTFQHYLGGPFLNNLLSIFSPDGPLSKPALAVVWNAMDSVDTFFLIGSILLSYLTLKELDKNGGGLQMWLMFYIHRYLRLTGVYLIVILFHNTLLKYFAYGPQGYSLNYLAQGCQQDWWANILYINNFHGLGDCLEQSWYMAVDMQFFVFSPLIIYNLWKHPKFGLFMSGCLMVIATGYPLASSWVDEGKGGFFGDFESVYIKPWGRFQPYLLGLLVGYYLHRSKKQPKLPQKLMINSLSWLLAAGISLSCIFGISKYSPVSTKAPSLSEVVFYNGFNRLAWSCAVSWVIIACIKKRGGPINEFLSWSCFIPLARISYCMYLTHITVLFWHNSVLRDGISYGTEHLTYTVIGNVMITGAVSIALVLAFEMPMLHMEKLCFGLLGVAALPKAKRYQKQEKSEKFPVN